MRRKPKMLQQTSNSGMNTSIPCQRWSHTDACLVKRHKGIADLFTFESLELSSIDGVHVSIPAEELSGLDPMLLRQGACALLQQLLDGCCAVSCPDVIQHAHELWVALPENLHNGRKRA